jgi:predicted Rossmann-fold nucleotide-binding protein
MTDPVPPKRLFHPAREEAEIAASGASSPQTEHAAYRLAFQDNEFLLREDLRPVRFQLELLKPELLLDEAKIASTFVIYGSARIPEPDKADALIEAASTDEQRRIAEKLKEKSRFYDEARTLARLASRVGPDAQGQRHFVVCSGGGPSIMEAANRGAQDEGADSIGLNIVLPHEQLPNPYVTPSLSFQFHYFALRKMHFLLRARAVAVFPGGGEFRGAGRGRRRLGPGPRFVQAGRNRGGRLVLRLRPLSRHRSDARLRDVTSSSLSVHGRGMVTRPLASAPAARCRRCWSPRRP